MLLVDKLDHELQREADRLRGKPNIKERRKRTGGIDRGDFPELNEIEFLILFTERVTSYMAVINNDLNKDPKGTKKKTIGAGGKALKNIYTMITK
jgi:hypothetical protein